MPRLDAARERVWTNTAPFDALIALATQGAAPSFTSGTGHQRKPTPWTVFGGPLVSAPWGSDNGLPLAIMVAAAPGRDQSALAIAEHLEAAAPPLSAPTPFIQATPSRWRPPPRQRSPASQQRQPRSVHELHAPRTPRETRQRRH